MEVTKQSRIGQLRFIAAIVFGTGFTGLCFLLLKALISTVIVLPLSVFLMPGGILVGILSKREEFGSPLGVLAANALFYSIATYTALAIFWRNVNATTLRRATRRLVIPAVILFGLACVPKFNPLWPRGMEGLARQESDLQAALPIGMRLDQARDVLKARGIDFREWAESSDGILVEREGRRINASAGDRVVWARFQTEASVFPCGYDMEIYLVFSRRDDRLQQEYIHRFRICP